VDYIVLSSREPGNELVAAECEVLTGGRPGSNGLAACKTVDRVVQAAYLSLGMQLIAHGKTLPALTESLSKLSLSADRFRIEFISRSERVSIHKKDAIPAIADAIQGLPDLNQPQRRFLIIACDDEIYFGEILTESRRSYKIHNAKPYRTSSSLPSQLARALVNLTYPARTILDPCCGTGSILLEACATGVTAFGVDRNPKMVEMTYRNLLHFGYQTFVQLGDACRSNCAADAVVTDFPYGRFSIFDEENIRAILQQMTILAPLGVYVAGQDISSWLLQAGYRKVDVFRVSKRPDMIRFIHRAQRN
jgi:tRNA G10  N-methylase Trm11